MIEAKKLTPGDFIDPKLCDWFRVSAVTKGPKVCYACKTCHTVSKTKECPAFRDGETAPGKEG